MIKVIPGGDEQLNIAMGELSFKNTYFAFDF
jgi:hypothetical protein